MPTDDRALELRYSLDQGSCNGIPPSMGVPVSRGRQSGHAIGCRDGGRWKGQYKWSTVSPGEPVFLVAPCS